MFLINLETLEKVERERDIIKSVLSRVGENIVKVDRTAAQQNTVTGLHVTRLRHVKRTTHHQLPTNTITTLLHIALNSQKCLSLLFNIYDTIRTILQNIVLICCKCNSPARRSDGYASDNCKISLVTWD